MRLRCLTTRITRGTGGPPVFRTHPSSFILHPSSFLSHLCSSAFICGCFLLSLPAQAVERFPAPEFRSGYQLPKTETSPVSSSLFGYIDMAVLLAALSLSAWLVYTKRSRRGVFLLVVFSLLYFGFWRKGCICPIGSIQNVAYAATGHGYALPLGVAVFFLLPLLFTLFFGRVFCSSVCPLGAIQDVVLWKPIHIAPWIEQGIGLFAYAYLGLAVMYAAIGSDFVICRYDPFVGLFRLSASSSMLFLGAVFLLTCMFVGRTYCRFICPYGVILRLLSIFSKRQVSITPKDCVDCRLCEKSCPFGAIRYPTPRESSRRKNSGKRQLTLAIIALPLIVTLFGIFGYLGRSAFSRVDFTVRLAERVWQEEHGQFTEPTNESKAFRTLGIPSTELYQQAQVIQKKYAFGSTLFGVWMGLVIAGRLIALILRRQRTGYTADPAGCVACARCYLSCPVEHERLQQTQLIIA